MSFMKVLLIFALLLLLVSPVFADTKGNPDILKRNIIDDCQGVDEFGNCILNEETEPINERLTRTITKMGTSTATGLGIPESSDLVIVAIIIIAVVAIGIFILREASG